MKVNIEIECTPEEARAFMGLPDVSAANNAYVENITAMMKGASNPDQMREYANTLAPMGQAGLKLFQSFMEGGMRSSGGRTVRNDDDGSDSGR
ncbi:MAG: DUF6489 family protein [Erythrobacter sp.]